MALTRTATVAAVVILVLASSAGLAAPLASERGAHPSTPAQVTNETGDGTTITVTAQGRARAEPDVVVLRVASTAEADRPRTATERLAANVTRLRTALRNATIPADRVQTTDFNLFEVRREERDRSAYRAQQGFEIEVTNTSRAGEIIDVAVANGATEIRGVQFSLGESTRSRLHRQALGEAVGSAREQATALATGANLTVTGVRSITTGDAGGPAFETRQVAGDGTTIDAGPVTVTATVRVTFDATG